MEGGREVEQAPWRGCRSLVEAGVTMGGEAEAAK